MNIDSQTPRIVGALFLTGTIAGVLSLVFTTSILSEPDYLLKISENENQIILGVLMVLIMGFSLAMVPVVLFPIFKQYNQTLALGAVVFRGIFEGAIYIAIASSFLLLLTLSREYVNVGAPDASYFKTLGVLLLAAIEWFGQILAIVFSLGALMIYYLFYQSELIPRWLSVWGLLGAILYLSVPLMGMFGTVFEFLYFPLAVQEMVLALWLIVKGFNSSAFTSDAGQET